MSGYMNSWIGKFTLILLIVSLIQLGAALLMLLKLSQSFDWIRSPWMGIQFFTILAYVVDFGFLQKFVVVEKCRVVMVLYLVNPVRIFSSLCCNLLFLARFFPIVAAVVCYCSFAGSFHFAFRSRCLLVEIFRSIVLFTLSTSSDI